MSHEQIEIVEASLQRMSARLPGFPLEAILITRLLILLGNQVAQMLDHHVRPFGLSEGEFRVLAALFSQPAGTAHPSDLCSRAFKSPANMSRISDALVNRGLITRDLSAHDRRRMVLRVTDKGEKLVRALLPTTFAPLRELASVLSEPQQLIDQLKLLADKLDQMMAPAVAESPT